MYMAPITRAEIAPSRRALRRAVGLPVLLLALIVGLPWLAIQSVVAALVLAGRFVVQAVDHAGQIARGR